MTSYITKTIIVHGKVQGVYFRQSAKQQANALGVTGTVRNLNNGESVEIVATGSEANLKALIEWCRIGPPNASVRSIDVKESVFIQFDTFDIIR